MDEFDFIRQCLAPLACEPGALGLRDDAALLSVPPGQQLVITKDALCEGVHFIGDETPASLAAKALRVNLSDLAAMGASPYGYFLALMLPAHVDDAWRANFARGLAREQARYGLSLLGGDTTRNDGPLALSVTMLGWAPEGLALRRDGAKAGDDIYVSGTLGDASLGLAVARAQGWRAGESPAQATLLARYQWPEPRLALGQALRGVASACLDISDGLVQDMEHITRASGVAARLYAERLPYSDAARTLAGATLMRHAASGGDDYELLFTAPRGKRAALESASYEAPITRIGEIRAGHGVTLFDATGAELSLDRTGYRHF